ncbi:hypothetical protein Ancab_003615 [Ancistrocladus abbreviatus]
MATSFLSQNSISLRSAPVYYIFSNLLISLLLPVAYSVSFQFPCFEQNSAHILYQGDAVLTPDGTIDFNKQDYLCRVGLITYAERVQLWDSNSGSLSDFNTHFSFFINKLKQPTYSHGLAFFTAADGFHIPPGMQAYILEISLMLGSVLSDWVTIGFSAATGIYVERHVLQSWEFSSNLECETSHGTNAMVTKLIVGLTAPIGVLIVGGTIISSLYGRQRRMKEEKPEAKGLTSFNDGLDKGAGPRRFTYAELASATNNFFKDRKLGEGGFGGVYKGYLVDLGMAIPVKRISKGSKQGKTQYIMEVKVISRL